MQPFDFSPKGAVNRMRRVKHEKEFRGDQQLYYCTLPGMEDWILDAFEVAALEYNKPANVVGNVADHFAKV